MRALTQGTTPKGDVLATARIAGIQAAKRTPEPVLTIDPGLLTSVEDALARLESVVGALPVWQDLQQVMGRLG